MTHLPKKRRAENEAGFTLVELLVVLVILPLLLGAIAEALIVSLENTGTASNRLSDSVNAQTTSAYFVRDVQGATWITTNSAIYNSAQIYSATQPSVCGPTTSPGTLLIALYRPAAQDSGGTDPQALDVAYWLVTSGTGTTQTSQIVRYSCNANNPAGVTSVPITTAPAGTATGNSTSGIVRPTVNITPSRFLSTAGTGWTLTSAFAVVTTDVTLPGEILVTPSLANFVPGSITVATPFGPQNLSGCTLDSVNVGFKNCAGTTFPIFGGDAVTQSAMTGVSVSVSSPASNWTFSLTGAPRSSAQGQAITLPPPAVPALLTLGSAGIGIQDHVDAISVNGSIFADLGSLSCSGNAKNGPLTGITGTIQASGGTGGCQSPATGGIQPIPDPIAAQLPPCFPDLPLGAGPDGSGYYQPGRYSSLPNGAVLETGVFEVTTSIGGGLSLAPNAPVGDGVLLLLPGTEGYPTTFGFNCAASAGTGAAIQPGIVLPPLGNGPLPSVFNNNAEMRTMWLWQDRTNANPITWTANSITASTCPATAPNHPGNQAGLAYAPAAVVNLGGTPQLESGTLAVKAIQYAFGDNNIVLSGFSTC